MRESFFELGGHSMLAVRMFALLERRLDVRLPLATLMRAPTIAELAEEVERARDGGQEKPWEVLVPLKSGGSRPPLFLIHELGGDVLCYRDLVRHLDSEQPAYGLEAVGRDGRVAPMTRVEDMARRYVEEVREVQPRGPYLLAGLCIGGNVAYEMAHQLEQRGESVAFVGLLDAHPFGIKRSDAGVGGNGARAPGGAGQASRHDGGSRSCWRAPATPGSGRAGSSGGRSRNASIPTAAGRSPSGSTTRRRSTRWPRTSTGPPSTAAR